MVTVEVNLINSISLVKTDPGCATRTAEDQNSLSYGSCQKENLKKGDIIHRQRQVGHINVRRHAQGGSGRHLEEQESCIRAPPRLQIRLNLPLRRVHVCGNVEPGAVTAVAFNGCHTQAVPQGEGGGGAPT